MDLSRITTVEQTNRTRDANEMLKEGWVLLDTASGKDEEGSPTTWFILGLPGRDPIE